MSVRRSVWLILVAAVAWLWFAQVCPAATPKAAAKGRKAAARKPRAAAKRPKAAARRPIAGADEPELAAVREAVADLMETFGDRYAGGPEFFSRLNALETADRAGDDSVGSELRALRREALLMNPLFDFDELVLLKRKRGQLGLPTNHQCNPCLPRTGYDNEIAVLRPSDPEGKLRTLFRPKRGRYVGEIDLDFDAGRLLFTMPDERTWQIHEIGVDGTGLRQVSREEPDVDNFDACYLPDGRIVFASTASFTGVPCWHGKERACSLYVMNADGSAVRQLCYDQDLDLHPAVLSNGQVVYSRWDYTGIMHIYLRLLMVMNPDGTAQRAVYGSNSYYPNALYYPRAVPGAPGKLAAILSGYHGVNRMGELVLIDTTKGWFEADGIVQRMAHRGEPAVPVVRDALVDRSWPKFLHPYPLSEKHFITAAQLTQKASWGIYLVDVFDNVVPLIVDAEFDFFEPIPVKKTVKPPVLPDRVDPSRDDAVVYLHDVYAGPGLAGVPRGAVKRLRVAAYHFGFPGMAGPDKIGRAGPWEAMRILGTVPIDDDGSASFRVPANTPITVQPLDAEGKALALMRSWYTAMPGETAACVGCHEQPKDTPLPRYELAATRPPVEIEPWYGPARGFDFEREVQPALDKHCVGCHDGSPDPEGRPIVDLRSERFARAYRGLPLSKLGADRLEPEIRSIMPPHSKATKLIGATNMLYTPAYEALIPYVRRVNVEDYAGLHVPGEYHADTSELVQMLQKGHYNVRLDDEAWDRLVTWIDLNGPCHGTWGDVAAIPRGAGRRRWELAQLHGGPKDDPEAVPETTRGPVEPVLPDPLPKRQPRLIEAAAWPFDAAQARRRQQAAGPWEKDVDLGGGVRLRLVRIPAGEFVMGASAGEVDEYPPTKVSIARDFWITACEITNRQFSRFAPRHDSGLFMKRSLDANGPGLAMNGPGQPAARVSWEQAVAFCRWLSQETGLSFELPTEAQWEYACRAGSSSGLSYGGIEADFSPYANVADRAIDRIYTVTGGVVVLQDIPSDTRFDDAAVATADVGSYRPNAWGLFDLHGNVAEWTRTTYRPYPYRDDDGRNALLPAGRKVVRGGSYYDRPKRCRSAFRLSYPAWQRVHNVGFRVVCETPSEATVASRR
ncbi:MAG: SUMF1/EgtB/PvdO family nonheme iron enzyme [Planctomycetota bacterium]|jgi:formylglycine-generating enzyme required for sulfatase activity